MKKPEEKKRFGEIVRERSLLAAPTIIIVYPIVGFIIGYLLARQFNWPMWITMIPMLLGLIQAIREVYNLSKKVYSENGQSDERDL